MDEAHLRGIKARDFDVGVGLARAGGQCSENERLILCLQQTNEQEYDEPVSIHG